MSKKLVKTAKQQFEERLRELGNHVAEEINGETFHSGIDKEGHFHILRIGDADIEYSEFDYGCTLLELYNNEVFLDKLATEFAIGREGIKPILEWWSDAEKNHEPFTMADIVQFAPVKSFVEFEDLYEEVPDMRIITAKEQWEKDTDGLIAVRKNEGKALFVNITVSAVKFYDNYDGYACYSYPSLDEMRKDSFFVSRVVDELMRSANHNKIGDFMEWVREGGDFPLNPAVIYESEYQGFTFMKYEDKEESTEKPTVKNEFKEERDALREKMLEHIVELCDQGMSIDSESFLENATSVTWASGTYYDCANIRSVYLRESVDKGFEFSYECKYDAQGDSSDSYLSELSIETLACIIKAMQ